MWLEQERTSVGDDLGRRRASKLIGLQWGKMNHGFVINADSRSLLVGLLLARI